MMMMMMMVVVGWVSPIQSDSQQLATCNWPLSLRAIPPLPTEQGMVSRPRIGVRAGRCTSTTRIALGTRESVRPCER
ncbi:hypothetical protein B0H63DRAFT_482607 [Podospora didyma]|uniref:Secreted protein n=1 Tax=Podospora didyma TaxID=330526 RepID=A0AAE0N9S2_9PEZI|nr:hypothetical protein B0H63DRAFT_482607 [Podospora didyma]